MDLEAGTLRVAENCTDSDGFKRPKADNYRVVPIVEPLIDCLQRDQAVSPYTAPDNLVVYNPDREVPVGITYVRLAFQRTLEAIGIDETECKRRHLVNHGLRHFFASMSRDSGLSDFATSRLTGQRSVKVLEGYSNAAVIDLNDARTELGKRLRGNR